MPRHRLPNAAHRWLVWALFGGAGLILFYQLGRAPLFEPDEGRNAEKGRAILVLNDWVTPHDNLHPVLDKPIFFYWLIAASYKLFGVSEWAARLTPALAALACLALVYRFARQNWDQAIALWSTLILLSSAQFFILARVVIFDMALTFFITLALCMFYGAVHTSEPRRRWLQCAILYGALGAGTLIKGLVGLVVPGMIFFFYLLLSKRWAVLKEIHLIPGALLYLAIVLPWYLAAEARHGGYLKYYFWDEHFGRYATAKFERSQPWYYFVGVLLVGLLPWTVLLPAALKRYWQKSWDDKTIFVILWALLPLLFFSFSKSKLPQYILPIFPALAILLAATLMALLGQAEQRARRWLAITWCIQGSCVFYLFAGLLQPELLPRALRANIADQAWFLWLYGPALALLLIAVATQRGGWIWQPGGRLFGVNCLTNGLFLLMLAQIMIAIAPSRSAKVVAAAVKKHLAPGAQVVLYDTYLSGLPFYIGADKPVWLVTHEGKKKTFLGNYRAIGGATNVTTKWGDALLNFTEFEAIWNHGRQPLLVVIKEKNLPRLDGPNHAALVKLAQVNEYVLFTRR